MALASRLMPESPDSALLRHRLSGEAFDSDHWDRFGAHRRPQAPVIGGSPAESVACTRAFVAERRAFIPRPAREAERDRSRGGAHERYLA
jgi:hypothetical protein